MKPPNNGRILVRLHRRIPLEPNSDLRELAQRLRLAGLEDALTKHCVPPARRLAHPIPLNAIRALEGQARPSPSRSLASYWLLETNSSTSRPADLLGDLRGLEEVDTAYALHPYSGPTHAVQAPEPLRPHQDYLGPKSGNGFDALWAWEQPHGRGAGTGLVLCDIGWNPHHKDLREKGPMTLWHGVNRRALSELNQADRLAQDHGTAALGVTLANGGRTGLRGIAYEATLLGITSPFDGAHSLHLFPAILAALLHMKPGQFLLLEAQLAVPAEGAVAKNSSTGLPPQGPLPVEVDDAVFDAIRLATALGIVVVEPAGNGGLGLDRLVVESGTASRRLDGADPVADSGAIMVAASGGPHDLAAHDRTNFGRRVNCHAWGSGVLTAGYGDYPMAGVSDENCAYTRQAFNGTSAASALITGVALVVQGAWRAAHGAPLSPLDLRALMADPAHGLSGTGSKPIGVMPNLKDLFTRKLRQDRPAPAHSSRL